MAAIQPVYVDKVLGIVREAAEDDVIIAEVSNDPASIPLSAITGTLSSGNPTLTVSPSSGNAIRLWWVSAIPDPDNSATGSARVTLGATEVYRAPALAHRQRFDGASDESITVTIIGDGSFDVTIHYEEFTP